MKVERKQWGDVTILHFVGEFDAFNLPTFSSKIDNLIEQGNTNLVFNLRLLTFINSSALGYLVRTKKIVGGQDGDVVIVQPSKFVKRALTVLGLHEFFPMFETDEEGVLFFHKGENLEQLKIPDEVTPDEKLIGENAIMFRLLDDAGKDVLGPAPQIGKISTLYKEGLLFRWEVQPPGGRSALSTENFDELVSAGRAMHVKFRQPFVAKAKFFEADVAVMKVNKEINEEDVTEATIHVEYTDMDSKDKEVLDRFVDDLDELRGEVKK